MTSMSPAAQRKAASEALLRDRQIPINPHLPHVEDEIECQARSTEEVAWRAMALLLVAVKGEGLEQDIVEQILADYRLAPHLSPEEQDFVANLDPSEHQRIQFSWRYEAAWTLLWALGYVAELGEPTAICDVPMAVQLMQQRPPEQFIADAKLRSQGEILDATDLIYRTHWAVVDARLKGQEAPADLIPGVVMERHHALNWLVGYLDQPWDQVSTDT